MHCPSCGSEAPLTQKFCRSCGFSLERVPQLVAEQHSESHAMLDTEAAAKLQKRQREIERWLSITGIGFIVLVGLSMLVGLIYLMLAGNLPLVPGIVLLILILGGFTAASLAMYSERLKKTLSGSTSPKSRPLPESEVASKPLEVFEGSFPSVTEGTTKLLNNDDGKNYKS